ncbi:MAG: ankyrin repeat protein [Candidatus Latescibacterota bacterium]|jgi:ankyrin repeat protein
MKAILLSLILFSLVTLRAQDVFEAARKGDMKTLESLCGSTPDILNASNDEGYTPLMLAAYYGHENMISYLVKGGAIIDGKSKYGTPIMAATVKNNETIVDVLIAHGADPNIQDANGKTALLYCSTFGLNSIAEKLLIAGANPNLKDKAGNRALDYAILRQNVTLIKLLNQYQ